VCVCASPIFEAPPHVPEASTPAQKGQSPEKQGIVRFSLHFLSSTILYSKLFRCISGFLSFCTTTKNNYLAAAWFETKRVYGLMKGCSHHNDNDDDHYHHQGCDHHDDDDNCVAGLVVQP